MKLPRSVVVMLLALTLTAPMLHATADAALSVPAPAAQNDTYAERAKLLAAADTLCYYNDKLSRKNAESYAKFIHEAAARYSVDPGLITGLIVKESRGNANARSKYASGLMQVYWKVHKAAIQKQFPHIKTEKIMMEPRNNIFVGTWLFSKYMVNCKGNTTQALQRYLGSKSAKYVDQVMRYKKHYSERVAQNTRLLQQKRTK